MECAFIPQLKEHGTYHGQRVNIRQLTWLWVETPHRGPPLDLCISILCALDEALDTNYERIYGQRELKVVKFHVARLMAVHAVGLLIIDEIQDISNVKSGGDKALAGFFLKLNNMLKIPILMVGTYQAEAMLQQQMRHTRRSTGIGLPYWDPLSRTLKEWDTFLEFLWQYQYTKTPTALTADLADALFDECQGIPDFAVKAYFLCQDRLIATNSGKQSEKITAGLIRSVTSEYLAPARSLLQALRYKDREKLALLDDVKLPTLEETVQERREAYAVTLGFATKRNRDEANTDVSDASAACPSTDNAPIESANASELSRHPFLMEKRTSRIYEIVSEKLEDPEGAYQALANAGLIKSAAEFVTDTSA
jgi:hypothetical protein